MYKKEREFFLKKIRRKEETKEGFLTIDPLLDSDIEKLKAMRDDPNYSFYRSGANYYNKYVVYSLEENTKFDLLNGASEDLEPEFQSQIFLEYVLRKNGVFIAEGQRHNKEFYKLNGKLFDLDKFLEKAAPYFQQMIDTRKVPVNHPIAKARGL